MSLILILLAIFIERVTNFIRPIRNHYWLVNYAEKVVKMLGNNGYLGLITAVLPILIVVAILQSLLDSLAFGLGGFGCAQGLRNGGGFCCYFSCVAHSVLPRT